MGFNGILDEDDRSLFSEAVSLEHQGKFNEALNLLEQLLIRYPEKYKLMLIAAEIHWALGTFDSAVELCQAAVRIRPKSEMASLGLFHSLWKMGRKTEALDEVKRFMSISYSKDYAAIIKELNEKMDSDE